MEERRELVARNRSKAKAGGGDQIPGLGNLTPLAASVLDMAAHRRILAEYGIKKTRRSRFKRFLEQFLVASREKGGPDCIPNIKEIQINALTIDL
jgi:hypothetical protein